MAASTECVISVLAVPQQWGTLCSMDRRYHTIALAAVLSAAVAFAAPALAQVPEPETPKEEIKPPEPPATLPRVHGEGRISIDKLFDALKGATSDEGAKSIENRIWAIWLSAGGDTASFLMSRVKTAVDGKDYDLAIKLLSAIIDIRPDYVEAWNRRATIYFMKKDFGRSLEDIREVLMREPRHFGALSGLGMIMQEIGDEAHALDALRRALEVHPRLEKIPDLVKKLTEKVEGRDI
jgi:tetratricopeptide (TPR) repeat protein